MADVTFIDTFTVPQFKDEVGATALNLVRSPKTDKYFLADEAGNSVGAVSKKIAKASDLEPDCVVSLVKGDDGKEFYIMHNQGEGGNNTERTW